MNHQDRCRGVMVGFAVGNLLGLPCQGWDRGQIRHLYPGGIREIEMRPGYPDDDDVAQAVREVNLLRRLRLLPRRLDMPTLARARTTLPCRHLALVLCPLRVRPSLRAPLQLRARMVQLRSQLLAP